jgi:hypothetical protein
MTVSQSNFKAALFDAKLDAPQGLTDPKGRPAGKRFDVYRNNVIHSLLDALAEAFPVVYKLVGDEFFRAMSIEYARNYPPKTPLLMFYGEEFATFLKSFPPAAALPYLPDIARLEQARREAYHAEDISPIDPNILMKLEADTLMTSYVTLHPALRIVASAFPVFSIWSANVETVTRKIKPIAEQVFVFRPEFDLETISVPWDTTHFVERLRVKETLGDAYEQTLEIHPDFDLSEALSFLLGHGLITAITKRKEL